MRNLALALALALALVACTACGGGGGSGQNARPTPATLMLDWTPNPDHVGFYDARDTGLFAKAGLAVSIRAPSDPASPLKLVAAGRTDLAVSYEQEIFFAAAKGLPVAAVAAVVPRPLNSFIAIEPQIRSLHDLARRTVGITGVPSDDATLDTALRSAGLTPKAVKVVTVGYNLLPSLLAHKVDAVLGVYRNVEGIELRQRGFDPTIIPVDRAGVPTYDELVLVANAAKLRSDSAYRSLVRRFVAAFLAGTADAHAHPHHALEIMQRATASDAKFLARAVPATLALLDGPGGVGCIRAAQWQRFGAWMHAESLLRNAVPARRIVDGRFLPARCGAE